MGGASRKNQVRYLENKTKVLAYIYNQRNTPEVRRSIGVYGGLLIPEEVARVVGMSPTGVTRHLKDLVHDGILVEEKVAGRRGIKRGYRIVPGGTDEEASTEVKTD